MNQNPKQYHQQQMQVIDWLIDNFPKAFFKKHALVKPLKIGIYEDILDFYERLDSQPFTKKCLKEAIKYYSGSPAYLKAQKPNTPRVDIYGEAVEIVTPEQAAYAAKRYEEKFNKSTSQPKDAVNK